MGENRRTLWRIVGVLLALADLAERASLRSLPVLCLVLCILRPAEAIAGRFAIEASRRSAAAVLPLKDPALPAADLRAEALRLAAALRMLAAVLAALAAPGRSLGLPPRSRRIETREVRADLRSPAPDAPGAPDTS